MPEFRSPYRIPSTGDTDSNQPLWEVSKGEGIIKREGTKGKKDVRDSHMRRGYKISIIVEKVFGHNIPGIGTEQQRKGKIKEGISTN
jgi:hypothetical protein